MGGNIVGCLVDWWWVVAVVVAVVVGGVFLIDVCRGRRLFVGERLLFFGAAGGLYSFFGPSRMDVHYVEKVLSSRMTSASQFMMDIVSYHGNMSLPHAHPMPSSTCPPTVYGARQLDGILPIVSHGMRQNVTNHDTPRYKADM